MTMSREKMPIPEDRAEVMHMSENWMVVTGLLPLQIMLKLDLG